VQNAVQYGFILRYPRGKEWITGYDYEPWHYRFLGKELAEKVNLSGLTYDEYYVRYLD
jgi:D-alanyl-D-alanine carboxypeptidase